MAMSLRNINANFRDSPVDTALRNRTQSCPAGDTIAPARDQTRDGKMRRVPSFPRRRLRLERGIAGGDALKIDRPYLVPIARIQLPHHRDVRRIRLHRFL